MRYTVKDVMSQRIFIVSNLDPHWKSVMVLTVSKDSDCVQLMSKVNKCLYKEASRIPVSFQ